MDQMASNLVEYRAYEHPLLPKRIVKVGYCWPALLVGPAYLIYRRLWILLAMWTAALALAQYLAYTDFQICTVDGSRCWIENSDKPTFESLSDGLIILSLIILGFITNNLWEKDIINRGYVITKSLNARSMDEALAIIEREKNSPQTGIEETETGLVAPSSFPRHSNQTLNGDSGNIRPLSRLDKVILISFYSIFLLVFLLIAAK